MAVNRLKLLHVSPYAVQDPLLGGMPEAVKSISEALARAGHKVTVWASDVGDATGLTSEHGQMTVQTRLFRARFRLLGKALNSPLATQMMLLDSSMIREFDLVHLHGYWSSFTPSVALACIKEGIPLVLQPHGTLVHSGQKEFAKAVFQRLFSRRIMTATKAVVALTEEESGQVEKAGFNSELVSVVPNPLPTPAMDLPPGVDARTELGLPRGSRVILYLGRLHGAKGLRELLMAYALVRLEIPNAMLVLAGPDEGVKEELVRQVYETRLDAVVFPGPIVGRQKWLALRAADLVCLPSRFEAFPIALLEAVAAGTPFVVSDSVNLTGLTEGLSYISTSSLPELLARCLVRVLNDGELRLRLATNSQREASTRFSPTVVASKLEEVYRRASGRR